MIQATLKVTMLSEWLVAGGFDRSSGADQVQVRDSEGFPYIPGRTLRGLLREACETAAACEAGSALDALVASLFGREGEEGCLALTDATLPQEVVAAVLRAQDIEEREGLLRLFCGLVARTALTEEGVAKEPTLRISEVGIPGLVFLAQLSAPDKSSLQFLAFAAGLVRRLGACRYRGLGRCRLELLAGDQPVAGDIPLNSSQAEAGDAANTDPSD